MAETPDPNKHIREYLNYYFGLSVSPGYAVMIRGSWGIGKTFLIRKILEEQFPEGKEYIYVSLYGISKPEEIDTAILAAMYPMLETKAAKLGGRLINAAAKHFNVDGVLTLSDIVNRSTAAAYIFDDVERASMSFDAIFGYINHFVEHAGCRVVLVANETELEKLDGYFTKREKLVGQTLEAKSAVEQALSAFLEDVENDEGGAYLRSVQTQIVEIYKQGEINNLRVLKQTIWDFIRFYGAIEPSRRQHPKAMMFVLRLFFALAFEVKLGRLQSSDLRRRRDHWLAAAIAKDKNSNVKNSFDRYGVLDLTDTTLSDELLIEVLVRGVVDPGLIKRDLDASLWFLEPKDEPSWRTLWHRFEREEDDLESAVSSLQSEVAALHYSEPGEILHVTGVLLMMSDEKLIDKDRNSIIELMKNYIISLKDADRLVPLGRNSFLENIRHGAWSGLGFLYSDTEELGEIYRFLNEQRILARVERLPVLAERLMNELEHDPELFNRRLVGSGGEHSDLIDGPVLKEIDPSAFLATVLQQPAQVQYMVFQTLRSRHGNGGYGHGLEDERPWVKALYGAMLKLAETSAPVRRSKLKLFASWIEKNAQYQSDIDQ